MMCKVMYPFVDVHFDEDMSASYYLGRLWFSNLGHFESVFKTKNSVSQQKFLITFLQMLTPFCNSLFKCNLRVACSLALLII